jgi:HemY protein
MMRNLIWLVLLFAVAVLAAAVLGPNDGLVMVYWGGWRTELSLNLVLIGLLALGLLASWTLQAVSALLSLPRRAAEWRALRRERAAQATLREALAEYFGGRYGRARKAADKALALQAETPVLLPDVEFRLLARLLAAGSLHRLQDRTHRDEVVQTLLAHRAQPGGASAPLVPPRIAEEGARLLAAEWSLDDGDADRALSLLAELPPGAARRTQALRLKLQAARLARKPQVALQTARLLANHQAFSSVAAQSLLRSLAMDVLDDAYDPQQLRQAWSELEAADRRDTAVAARAAARAVQLGALEDARQWLRPFWDRFGELTIEDRERIALALLPACPGIGSDWLPRLEGATQAFGQEPAVMAAVGAAFADRELWGKARPLLEGAAADPTLSGQVRRLLWRILAALAREEGDESRALDCERIAGAID